MQTLTDLKPTATTHPIDWAKSASHISGLPEGTELLVWHSGKAQIARLHRIIPNGEQWNIYTQPRYEGAAAHYIYSVGYRYIIEHTI